MDFCLRRSCLLKGDRTRSRKMVSRCNLLQNDNETNLSIINNSKKLRIQLRDVEGESVTDRA